MTNYLVLTPPGLNPDQLQEKEPVSFRDFIHHFIAAERPDTEWGRQRRGERRQEGREAEPDRVLVPGQGQGRVC